MNDYEGCPDEKVSSTENNSINNDLTLIIIIVVIIIIFAFFRRGYYGYGLYGAPYGFGGYGGGFAGFKRGPALGVFGAAVGPERICHPRGSSHHCQLSYCPPCPQACSCCPRPNRCW